MEVGQGPNSGCSTKGEIIIIIIILSLDVLSLDRLLIWLPCVEASWNTSTVTLRDVESKVKEPSAWGCN
jgi:hypothetical protein